MQGNITRNAKKNISISNGERKSKKAEKGKSMIAIDVIQGSDEWAALRAGIPTASNFDKLITTKGEPSKQAQKYLYQLAGERLIGTPMNGYQSDAMLRGQELEAEARASYELITDNTIQQVGFCFRDERRLYGCSPDSLIGDEGGLEIKCPTLPVAVEYLDKGKLPADYYQQVQGNLLVTGREWWDFMSYFPGLPPLIVRATRHEDFLQALEYALVGFCENLEALVKRLHG